MRLPEQLQSKTSLGLHTLPSRFHPFPSNFIWRKALLPEMLSADLPSLGETDYLH